MSEARILIELLCEKDLVNRDELERARAKWYDESRPRSFLTEDELREVREALSNLNLPHPTCLAESMAIHILRNIKEHFSPNHAYDHCSLQNLISALRRAGCTNEGLLARLEEKCRDLE